MRELTLTPYLVHDRIRYTLHPSSAPGGDVQGTGLVAADDTDGLGAGPLQGYREAGGAGKGPAAGDREHHRDLRKPVEGPRRDDEYGPSTLLLMTGGRVKPDQVDVPALHQISSLPQAPPSNQSRSSSAISPPGSHWASSSSRR